MKYDRWLKYNDWVWIQACHFLFNRSADEICWLLVTIWLLHEINRLLTFVVRWFSVSDSRVDYRPVRWSVRGLHRHTQWVGWLGFPQTTVGRQLLHIVVAIFIFVLQTLLQSRVTQLSNSERIASRILSPIEWFIKLPMCKMLSRKHGTVNDKIVGYEMKSGIEDLYTKMMHENADEENESIQHCLWETRLRYSFNV